MELRLRDEKGANEKRMGAEFHDPHFAVLIAAGDIEARIFQ